MKIKKLHIYLAFLLSVLFGNQKINCQEPVFSQFNMNPIYMNPALSGINNVWSLGLNLRQQWPTVTSKFLTQSISFDTPLAPFARRSSFSICYLRNIEGEGFLNSNYIRSGISYMIPLIPNQRNKNNMSLKLALEYQNYSRSIDWSRLIFLDELHPLHGDIYNSSFIAPNNFSNNSNNFHFGTLITMNKNEGSEKRKRNVKFSRYILLGFAAHNMVERGDNFIYSNYFIPKKYTFHGEIWWNDREFEQFSGIRIMKHSFFYQQQSVFRTLQIGLFETDFLPFNFGVFYRQQATRIKTDSDPYESIYLKLGFKKPLANNLSMTFAFSKDFTISNLKTHTNGINEFSIIIKSMKYGILTNAEKEKTYKLKNQTSCQFYKEYDGNLYSGGLNPLINSNRKKNKKGMFNISN